MESAGRCQYEIDKSCARWCELGVRDRSMANGLGFFDLSMVYDE